MFHLHRTEANGQFLEFVIRISLVTCVFCSPGPQGPWSLGSLELGVPDLGIPGAQGPWSSGSLELGVPGAQDSWLLGSLELRVS